MAQFNEYIKINGGTIPVPPDFSISRQDMYAGEYVTCTGDVKADRIGWRYANTRLKWRALEQQYVDILVGMTGESTIEFVDTDGVHTEAVARAGAVYLPHRYTYNGTYIWENVEVELRFLNGHTD